jgi:hypothetical protein
MITIVECSLLNVPVFFSVTSCINVNCSCIIWTGTRAADFIYGAICKREEVELVTTISIPCIQSVRPDVIDAIFITLDVLVLSQTFNEVGKLICPSAKTTWTNQWLEFIVGISNQPSVPSSPTCRASTELSSHVLMGTASRHLPQHVNEESLHIKFVVQFWMRLQIINLYFFCGIKCLENSSNLFLG